jgi:dihydroxyacetone kinase
VTIIKTILSNLAFAVVTVFTLIHIVNNYLLGIVPLIGLWIIFDYIKNLEQKTIDIKTKKIGTFSYFLTAIIGLILFVL